MIGGTDRACYLSERYIGFSTVTTDVAPGDYQTLEEICQAVLAADVEPRPLAVLVKDGAGGPTGHCIR